MKKRVMWALVMVMAMAVTSGCATSTELIKTSIIGTRNDVFQELTDGGSIPQGYANLRITYSMKTHNPGIYSAKDLHGTPDYKLLLNIDGQVVQLQGSLNKENGETRVLRDTEAGEGIRYQFNKNLRLHSGTHKVVIAIPADDLAIERVITLNGNSNSLILEPVYSTKPGKRRPGAYSLTNFKEGIRSIKLTLNDREI